MALNPGDIAFVSYNADDPDSIQFVALVNIPAGEVINFTDNGWRNTNSFRTGEGIITWTAPGTVVSAGTVVTLSSLNTTAPGASLGSVVRLGGFALAVDGDQVIAYQGPNLMIAALNNEGAAVWQANATDSNTSALPFGLINGADAVALNEIDNAVYSGSLVIADKAALLAAINTPANWTGSDTVAQSFTGTITVNLSAAPVLANLDSPVTVNENAINVAAQVIDSDVTLTDSDSLNFNGGNLTVSYSSGGSFQDTLFVRNQGTGANQIGLDGRVVTFGGTTIGTIARNNIFDGSGGSNLVISLNANATPAAVEALIENLTYRNTSNTPNPSRTLQITVNDGSGGVSSPQPVQIDITPEADLPIVGPTTVLYDNFAVTPDNAAATSAGAWFGFASVSPPSPPAPNVGNATQSANGTATSLNTAGNLISNPALGGNLVYSGYSNHLYNPFATTFTLVNSSFPALDRVAGYTINFRAKVDSENNDDIGTNQSDKNKDGKLDRAGFGLVAISSDGQNGIELYFDSDRIFALEDGLNQATPSAESNPTNVSTHSRQLFNQAEGASFNTVTAFVNYQLAVQGNTYILFADGTEILTGRLRNYTAADITPPLPDPYGVPNFLFLGDDTPSAQVQMQLQGISVTNNLLNSLVVDTTVDENDGNLSPGDVSLREALANIANNGTITFDNSFTNETITLALGELPVNKSVTINGDTDSNPATRNITVSGNNASRVFNITDGNNAAFQTVTIDGLTITRGLATGGFPAGSGGGIYNRESLSLSNSTISGNSASYGGGIFNYLGTAAISNSTISGNSATNRGGGIFNYRGTAAISNSTISGNSANNGGGITNYDNTVALVNTTISENIALVGSGIASFGDSVTFTTVTSSIISGNTGGGADVEVFSGTTDSFTSAGNNLIGGIGANVNAFSQPTDITGVTNPLLGPLQNNGGPTFTQALLTGSPAIDTGSNPNSLTTDQRGTGFNRVIGPAVDIGAFEASNQPPTAVDDGGTGFTIDQNTLFTTGDVLANDTDPENDTLTVTGFNDSGTLGTVTNNANGTFEYNPDTQFNFLPEGATDTDSFTYTIQDSEGNPGVAPATVTITVEGLNDAPTVALPLNAQSATPTNPFSFVVPAGTFDDVDTGDILTLSAAGLPTWLTFDPVSQTFSGTPANADGGVTTTITVTATDALGATVSDDFDLQVDNPVVNDPPIANNDSGTGFITNQNALFTTGNVLANDTDPENDTLSVTGFNDSGTQGIVTNNANGTFDYDPDTQFNFLPEGVDGTDSFTYTIQDSAGNPGVAAATVTITVEGLNDAPTVALPLNAQSATPTTPFSFVVPAGTFDDVDTGDVLTLSAAGLPTWLTFNPAAQTFSGTPANADGGVTTTITVTATDILGATVSDDFDLQVDNPVVNDPP
ncbi:MAG: choice-of-anchor Y domain-containing protein, partial [Microcoleaceae cyanobacterium]